MKADRPFLDEHDPEVPLAGVPSNSPRCSSAGALWRRLAAPLLGPAIALLAVGCVSEPVNYKLVPPTTTAGKDCIAQCDEQRKSCAEQQQNTFDVCQGQYREAMATYTRCRNSSLGPAPGSQFGCNIPRACQLPSGEACDEAYRACFETCGGKVEQAPAP